MAHQAVGRHEVALELPEHLARELEVLAKHWTSDRGFFMPGPTGVPSAA